MKRGNWPDNLIEEICHIIKETRLSKEFSIYELAQRSGVSQQGIAYYEKLERRPTLDCLAKIAKGLDFTLSQLISMAEKRISC